MNNALFRSSFRRGIQKAVTCDQSTIKYSYIYYMSMLNSLRAQSISLNGANSNNKYQYRQYKSCLSTLLQNIYHDAVSGWLMLASFFYKEKQYSKALRIIMYSIPKYSYEKMYNEMKMADSHQQILKWKSLQKKSIVHLWKFILIDDMIFEQNSVLIPDELQIEVNDQPLAIPSSAYAYFLWFLCHYHLNNVSICQDILKDLRFEILNKKHLMANLLLIVLGHNLLGVAFQILEFKTQDISIALYRCMCQNIVGTEDRVQQIRLMNPVRDNLSGDMHRTITTSGSFGEGLSIRGIDLDMMYLNKSVEVFEYVPTPLNPNRTYVVMQTDDIKLGFHGCV
ncbi:unnamed protein product [Mytilus coruscus]|uniref:Uncharacterized protein n=1 Tax=Mytilus coruscus TaxID=42192 RepID=A0A6J8EQU7_MYTCO|nr:unnamed protein product [Mytilus coruscus]